jgi:hypothetical protein
MRRCHKTLSFGTDIEVSPKRENSRQEETMLNTFENAERQHLRRLERERHMNVLESIGNREGAFVLPLEGDDMSHAVDALAGIPLAEPPEENKIHVSEERNRSRWWRSNRIPIIAVGAVVLAILLAFTLGVDFGEHEEGAKNMNVINDDKKQSNSDGLARYNRFFSQILDWGLTSRETLENVSSAPARALHWISYEDRMILADHNKNINIETVRTRFALATLFYSTQNTSFMSDSFSSSSWLNKLHWLSSYPVCLWYGVDCLDDDFGRDSMGLVKSLNLSANGLVGALPNEIGLLQLDLRTLDVSFNDLVGTIPQTLSSLRNLSKLCYWSMCIFLSEFFR